MCNHRVSSIACFLFGLSGLLAARLVLAANGLDYLNQIRAQAGLVAFSENTQLQQAAQNHAVYLAQNNLFSHYENQQQYPNGFTGATVIDRAGASGFQSTQVSENISFGQSDYQSSIDGLMSAIYHRFGFLNPVMNLIGMSSSEYASGSIGYVYNMSNNTYNTLCQQGASNTSGGYYTSVCQNGQTISASEFDAVKHNALQQSPDMILWPTAGSVDNPPVFYEEEPDPLPDLSVSGYPVSIEVNTEKISGFSLQSIQLYREDNGTVINNTRLLDQQSDPNQKFSAEQFALFPLDVLENNTWYRVFLSYQADGKIWGKSWAFKTRTLGDGNTPVYRIESQTTSVTVSSQSNHFILYFPPDSNNPGYTSFSVRYTSGLNPDISFVDQNTLDIKLTPFSGGQLQLTLDNSASVSISIANSNLTQSESNTQALQRALWNEETRLLSLPAIQADNSIYSVLLQLVQVTTHQLEFALVNAYPNTHQDQPNSVFDGKTLEIDTLIINGQAINNVQLLLDAEKGIFVYRF